MSDFQELIREKLIEEYNRRALCLDCGLHCIENTDGHLWCPFCGGHPGDDDA